MKRLFILSVYLTLAFVGGCGKPQTAAGHRDGGGHEDHGAEGGASFADGKGVSLVAESKKALDLKTVEVGTRKLAPSIRLQAQVYQTAAEDVHGRQALASAMTSPDVGERVHSGERASFTIEGEFREGIVKSVDATQKASIGKVEVLLALDDPQGKLAIGAFVPVSIRLPEAEITGVPRSAVLETSTGKFVYVQNGEYLLRTPVSTGIESEDLIEITDGLYEGDVVVSQPVESLYLIELRATKGGGHCH